MNQRRDPKPTGGLDLLLICVAATLALVCIPMIFEFSGGSGRALLFACMLLPPAVGLGWVQSREGQPARVRRPRP